jgi:hypothetical protein
LTLSIVYRWDFFGFEGGGFGLDDPVYGGVVKGGVETGGFDSHGLSTGGGFHRFEIGDADLGDFDFVTEVFASRSE